MKKHPSFGSIRFTARALARAIGCLLIAGSAPLAFSQAAYTWTHNVDGTASESWTTATAWNPNGLPVSGDTADFSTLDITNASAVSLGGDQAIGNLVFGDVVGSADWTLDASGTLTLQTASGAPSVSVTNRTATIQAPIAGTQGFTKLGAGALVLANGGSAYSGVTTLGLGTLTISAAGSGTADAPTAGPFGVSTLSLEGGTLNVASGGTSPYTIYNRIIVPAGKAVAMGTAVSGIQLALPCSISGGGTINEFGSSTAGTHLSGTNSGFTGTFVSGNASNHRVRFDHFESGSASAAWVNNNGQTDGWGFTGMGTSGNTIHFGSFAGSGQMRSDNGNNTSFTISIGALNTNTTWSGVIAANGTQVILINKVGAGTQIFSGNNTYNGATTISGGTLQLGAGGAAGNLGSLLVTNNSQLVFSYNRSDVFAFPALLTTGTGSLSFTNLGAGTMTLTGTNTLAGDITIAAGAVRLLNPFALPGGPGLGSVAVNGTLDVNSNSIVINGLSGSGIVDNITNAGTATLTIGSNGASSTFAGVIRNTGGAMSVVKAGAGIIALGGVNTYSGTTTVSGGELDINTTKTGGGAITVSASATLGVLASSAASIPAASLNLGSAASLNFSGISSTTIAPLNATNLAPSGNVTINVAGSFVAGSQYPLIKYGSYTGAGGFALGTLPVGTTATLVTNGSTIALNVTAAAPLVWKGNVSGNWDIATSANWTLNSAAATYVDGQTVQFLDSAATGNVNLAATVSPGGVLVSNSLLAYTFSSATGQALNGSSGLSKLGAGSLTLSGLTNTYSGATLIGGGTVVIDRDQNLGSASGSVTINGGVLSAAASLTLNANRALAIGPASGSGTGTMDVASGQTLTFAGIVANNGAGTGTLNKAGSGTLALSGANIYSGGTVVSAGKLSLTTAQQSGGAITVNNSATLGVTRSGGTTLPVSTLTMGTGGATTLELGNLSSAAAVITVTNLITSGTVTLSIPTGVPALGEIPLIKYSGTIGGAGFGAFSLAALPSGVTAVLTNDTANKIVGLLVTDVAALTWTGANGSVWDVGVTTNWQYLGAGVTFSAGSPVILDDTAVTNRLDLNFSVSLFKMTVTNDALAYSLNGSGALSGPMTLTKSGTNVLTLANLGNNTFTGGTVVEGGVLDVRNNNSLGTGPITLAGGTLENNSATAVTLANNVVVPTNTSSVIQSTGGADPQMTLTGNLTGGGTLTAMLQGTSLGGLGLSGDNSGFTGTFITSNNTSLRFNFNMASAGSARANWILESTGTDNHRIAFGNGTISFGSLSGNGNCRQDAPNTLSILRIGDLNTDSTWGGTLNQGNASQRLGILKVGAGTWTITASQPFTGPTTISNGVLALANNPVTLADGALAGTTNIHIATGAALDVSGRSDANISLGAAQMLSGGGTVRGNLDTFGAGTIAPGDGYAGSLGTLTVTNTLSLGGTAWMKLNRAASPNSDRLVSPVAINFGGTLVVTNEGAALQPGDTFALFSSPTFNGSSFGTLVLPKYQAFDTSNLGVNGTITFLGANPPAISGIDFGTLASGYITVSATNGMPDGAVNILTSTNLALPVGSWTPVSTNVFDGAGNYTEVITVDPAAPQQYFRLRVE